MKEYLVLLIDNNTGNAIVSKYFSASHFASNRSLVRQAKNCLGLNCKHTVNLTDTGIKLTLHGLTVHIVITRYYSD